MMTYTTGNNHAIGGSDVQGLQETRVPNPGITWEVSKTWNFGLEASFWNSRLWMEFDFFRSVRDHLLTTRHKSVPEYTGMTLPNENIGKVLNRGFELVIGHRNRVGELAIRSRATSTSPAIRCSSLTRPLRRSLTRC